MGKITITTLFLITLTFSLSSVIPNPLTGEVFEQSEIVISEIFVPNGVRETREGLPQHVLVLPVEFSDVFFADTIDNDDFWKNPDYTISDYIERFMYHLRTYYLDVSYDSYSINYTLLDSLIRLSRPMAYYGDPGRSLERRVQLVQDVVSYIDPLVTFSEYDAYVILHAGAGRESDIYGTNPNSLSSSFLNRRLMQSVLEPDNDDFPGIPTSQGDFIKEIVISATNHNHPDNPEDLNYGVLGLLCHLFGRQIGLPTLFGNVASLGRAAGAGNFCLMGTGVWNANGFVPPFLSAWTRLFAGWGEAEIISQSRDNLQLSYPFNPEEIKPPYIYKVLLSDDEYFLIENRQQNPDGSTIDGQPSFTFHLLPDGEQDYYDDYPNVPRFNFMKNSYRGCEWDFFLPGYGTPGMYNIDGSGILIWHIDENIIRENYEKNTINANPNHQGVTLQEADGIQHLRSSMPDVFMRGSPYDSFRRDHNDYFGKMYKDDGTISVPFVESYYGSAELEIFNISRSMNIMSFSVRYPWSLSYPYEGTDVMPPAVVSVPAGQSKRGSRNAEEDVYLLQTAHSGNIFLFKNYELLPDYPVVTDSIPELYTYLEESQTFIIPLWNSEKGAAYYRITTDDREKSSYYTDYEWATHPIALSIPGSEARLAVALRNIKQNSALVLIYNESFDLIDWFAFTKGPIVSNMMLQKKELQFFIKKSEDQSYVLQTIDLDSYTLSHKEFQIPVNTGIRSSYIAPVTKREIASGVFAQDYLVLTKENTLLLFDDNGALQSGFPVSFEAEVLSLPSLADINFNGYLETLLVSSNNLYVVSYNGELLNYPLPTELPYPEEDTGNLGIIALDFNGNNRPSLLANLGGNRFLFWNNDFSLNSGYPLLLPNQPRNYPLPVLKESSLDIYLSSENGSIYRQSFDYSPSLQRRDLEGSWLTEYGNLQRTAFYSAPLKDNVLKTEKVFLKEHCYVFPVPLTYSNGGVLYFNIKVSQNLPVEVKVFDISGRLIFKEIHDCQAYTNNRNKLSLSIGGFATGVYYAVLKAKGDTLTLPFAVEK